MKLEPGEEWKSTQKKEENKGKSEPVEKEDNKQKTNPEEEESKKKIETVEGRNKRETLTKRKNKPDPGEGRL